METAAILQLVALGITAGPEIFSMITKIIAGIRTQFKTADERIAALQSVLSLLAPMEREA